MSGMTSSLGPIIARTPRSIVNAYSSGSPNGVYLVPGSAVDLLSGALTANTLATMLTVNGPGVLTFAGVRVNDATARTVRLQLTMDGTVVFDSTSASISTSGHGIIAVGYNIDTTTGTSTASTGPQALPFASSLVLKIASSITETDKISALYSYYTV